MNEFFKELQEENGLIPRKKSGAADSARMTEKLDILLSHNNYSEAEKLLCSYLREAVDGNLLQLRVAVLNEMMGLYRKTARREKAFECADDALQLIQDENLSDTVTDATVSLNAATVFKCFDENVKAFSLYEHARTVYERDLSPDDERLAGLYNNEALALTSLGEYENARRFFEKALNIMLNSQGGQPEAAVTCLNLADLAVAENGLTDGAIEADGFVCRAAELLDSDEITKDGNYAFVCEKCAPVFDKYGYFAYADELKERAEEIYERT